MVCDVLCFIISLIGISVIIVIIVMSSTVFENTYFTFFSDFKKHDFLRFFELLHTYSRTLVINHHHHECVIYDVLTFHTCLVPHFPPCNFVAAFSSPAFPVTFLWLTVYIWQTHAPVYDCMSI